MHRQYVWLTDLHVDKLSADDYAELISSIIALKADGVWLTGDIGDPPANWVFLETLLHHVKFPIYFVLGNHDYYQQRIADVRKKANQLMDTFKQAHYLTNEPAHRINEDTLLVGVDGWANTADIPLAQPTWDSERVMDLQSPHLATLQQVMNKKAAVDASLLLSKCQQSIRAATKRVYILTHVPPEQARCGQYPVKPLQARRAVYYSCALGGVLDELRLQYPLIHFYVFSGHVHQNQLYRLGHNLHGQLLQAYKPANPLTWVSL